MEYHGGCRPFFFFPVALRPDSGSWTPLTGLSDHTHWTHHTRYDSSERVISPTQIPLPNNTTLTRDKHPYPRRDRTRNPSKRAAADPRLRPRGCWDRRMLSSYEVQVQCSVRREKEDPAVVVVLEPRLETLQCNVINGQSLFSFPQLTHYNVHTDSQMG